MMKYLVTYNHEGFLKESTVEAKSAQEAVNYVKSWCEEHDEIILVERIGRTGTLVECTQWK